MGKVPLTFDVPSTRTVENKGAVTITIKTSGRDKTHYTAIVACCTSGAILPPVLILKRETIIFDKIP
jgi:hypothetical protein